MQTTIEAQQCVASPTEVYVTGSSGTKYRVLLGDVLWCDCPAFRLQKGPVPERTPCKHIVAAVQETCGWISTESDLVSTDGTCPECGGPVESIYVGAEEAVDGEDEAEDQ